MCSTNDAPEMNLCTAICTTPDDVYNLLKNCGKYQ